MEYEGIKVVNFPQYFSDSYLLGKEVVSLIESTFDKKAVMYALIKSLEHDFVINFAEKLTMENIPDVLIKRSNRVEEETNVLLSYLMGLDIQAYIEICNANIDKLNITIEQRKFINSDLSKLIPIRNKVMHPRPIEITDLPILQAVTEVIPTVLLQFNWKELRKTLQQVKDDPSSLQLPPVDIKKSNSIIENLPSDVDFEETSFIGRKKEIGEIKAKLHKNNVHVLSIIGDGGIGKTAIALKMLYDMLDDTSFDFNLILWVSLKTSQLSGYEFKRIDQSITSTSQMYSKLAEFIGRNENTDTPTYLIELAKNFHTLLVLDNLETVNSEEVKSFIDDFSEYGKVLITSRIGLGEMEHRYQLEGLNNADVLEYMNTLLELYGFPGLLTDDEKLNIAQIQLHSNPLAIKWFVKNLYSGKGVDEVLSHKDELIAFCMSNVYEKLSNEAKNVLETIQILKMDLSFGELIYFNEASGDDFTKIKLAINELIKCNFLDATKYRVKNVLSVTAFASEFLDTQIFPNHDRTIAIRSKSTQLTAYKQRLEQKRISAPSANDTFFFYGQDNDRIIATYYLTEAIKALNAKSSIQDVLRIASIAKMIASDYLECATTFGLLYSNSSPEKARVEYKRAIDYSTTDEERAFAYFRYARFLRTHNLYQETVDQLEAAILLNPNDLTIKFELIMSLCWINKFQRAKEIFNEISYDQLSTTLQIEYSIRFSDMLRREADEIAQTNNSHAFELLKEAFRALEAIELKEKRVYESMANILCAIAYLYLDDEIIEYIIEKLEIYYPFIRKANKFRKFKEVMASKISIVTLGQRDKLSKYLLDTNLVLSKLEKNQGIVIVVKKDFAFFRINGMEQNVYFKTADMLHQIEVGDIVSYQKIMIGGKGPTAINVQFVKKLDMD